MTSDNYNTVFARQVALLPGEEKSNHQQPDEVLVATSSSYDDQVIKDIDRLKKMVGKRDEEINQLKEMVAQRNKEMESLKSSVSCLMKEVNLLKSTAAVREHKSDKRKSSILATFLNATKKVSHAGPRRFKATSGDIWGKRTRTVQPK